MGNTDPRLGRRIAEARRAAGLTQDALAQATGIDRTALSKIEHGRRSVGSLELRRIARGVGRTVDSFFDAAPPALRLGGLKRRRRAILRIASSHGADRVRVFGSVARGEAHSDSDVDLLVRMGPERSLFDQGGLLMDLRDLLGREVDVVSEGALRGQIRERIFREAVLL